MTRLTLCKETLAELTADELSVVRGAGLTGTETYRCPTLPLTQCPV